MTQFILKLPALLEILINGSFVLLFSLLKSKKLPNFLSDIRFEGFIEEAWWFAPVIVSLVIFFQYLVSNNLDDFLRKNVFSLIIFVPMLITLKDIEFTYWLSSVHLFSTIISWFEPRTLKSKKLRRDFRPAHSMSNLLFRLKLQPAQVVLISFGGVILIGTVLLSLPFAVAEGKSVDLIDAFFMATSATCVTGLVTMSVIDDFSLFGQLVLLTLFQIGGLGIMTLSSSLSMIFGKALAVKEQVMMQDMLDASNTEELTDLIINIVKFSLAIEFLGGMILSVGFFQEGYEIGQAMYYGFFHSISAFCNAGFSLFNNSLEDFRFSPMITIPISLLIIIGGIGFYVIQDFYQVMKSKRGWQTFSTHTKIVLTTNTGLLMLSFFYIFFGEFLNAFEDLSIWQKTQLSLFQAVTIRSAGFNTINLNELNPHVVYLMILMMFVGASPGSTGGGIKTSTFAVLIQSVISTLRGEAKVQMFERNVPTQTVVKAIAIFIISLLIVSGFLLMMIRVEADKSFFSIFFETVSAFGTVGLSMGITADLSSIGKMILSALMFVGRVGPLTLVLAVGSRVVLQSRMQYPEGKVLIG